MQVWAYCLILNHAHLIAVPASEEELRRGIGEAHRLYARRRGERAGRAAGSEAFVAELERLTGRRLQGQEPGAEAY